MNDLSKMKYTDLQKIAKTLGIKSKQKSQKLIEEISKVRKTNYNEPEIKQQFTEIIMETSRKSLKLSDSSKKPKKTKSISKSPNKSIIVSSPVSKSPKIENNRKSPRSSFSIKHESPTKKITISPKKRKSSLKTEISKSRDNQTPNKTKKRESYTIKKKESLISSGKKAVEVPSLGKTKEKMVKKEEKENNKKRKRPKPFVTETSNEAEKDDLKSPVRKRLRSSSVHVEKKQVSVKRVQSKKTAIPKISKSLKMKKLSPKKINWEKIHQKNFDKMDSIDVYQKKKEERAFQMWKSPVGRSAKKDTPKNEKKLNVKYATPKIFEPKVFDISKANFNFTSNNETDKTDNKSRVFKFSATLKSPLKSISSKSREQNSTFQSPATKTKFDLVASLEKPLTWVPYTGKLKPYVVNIHNDAPPGARRPLRSDPKDPKIKNRRVNARNLLKERRKGDRFERNLKRRGL